jgi:hypothetical protein
VTVRAAGSITISGLNSGLLSEVAITSKGDGGRLKIESPSASLMLADRGNITTRNQSGNANTNGGNIDIKVKSLGLSGRGEIFSRATKGSGGSVKVTATDTITISGQAAGVRSGIRSGTAGGPAGAIEVVGRTLAITDNGEIQIGLSTDPQGGNMTVRATDSLLISNGAASLVKLQSVMLADSTFQPRH